MVAVETQCMPAAERPSADSTAALPLVLVVDSSPVDRLLAGSVIAQKLGYPVLHAADPPEALRLLDRAGPGLVLVDLLVADAVDLVQQLHRISPQTPIILLTGPGSEAIAFRALCCGAVSYVPKKDLENDLAGTIEEVLAVAHQPDPSRLLHEVGECFKFHFHLENDRTLIPDLVRFLQDRMTDLALCDDADRIRIGIALEESLLNAMYHGNLEVSSDLREEGEELYYRVAEERRRELPFRCRRVHMDAILSRQEAQFIIRDEGPGFVPASIPDPTDPANLERISGRGLLLIQTFMDEVRFNEAGNQITMTKRRTGEGKTPCERMNEGRRLSERGESFDPTI
jgi:CheY-like chemotaxis protein